MNRVEKFENRYRLRTASEVEAANAGSAWALIGGVLAATLLIQAILAARLLVQVMALNGGLANAAYQLGGFFQGPFDGYSDGAIKTKGIFEPETVMAMSAYALIAVVASCTVAVVRTGVHKTVWNAWVATSRELAWFTVVTSTNGARITYSWLTRTGIPVTRRVARASYAYGRRLATEAVVSTREAAETGIPAARRMASAAASSTRVATMTLVDQGSAEIQRSTLRLIASVRESRRLEGVRVWPPLDGRAVEPGPLPLRARRTRPPEDDHAA